MSEIRIAQPTISGFRGNLSPSHPVQGAASMYVRKNQNVSDPSAASLTWNSPLICSCTPGRM